MEQSNSVQVDFFELNQPNKYNFSSQIRLSDTSFEIAIDDTVPTLLAVSMGNFLSSSTPVVPFGRSLITAIADFRGNAEGTEFNDTE